jgi:hypothetical protein
MFCWIVAAIGSIPTPGTSSSKVRIERRAHHYDRFLSHTASLFYLCADLIAQHKDSSETLSPHDKKQIVHKIMDCVLQRGRFLRRINNKWIVVSGDNAYLEVAQVIQYTRKQSRRKPIQVRPQACRPSPASSCIPSAPMATENVPEYVIAPRLHGSSTWSADSALSMGRQDHHGGKSSRPSFHESDNDYNHELMMATLRQAMSDPRYTRLDACRHAWNNDPVHSVASRRRDTRTSPVVSIETLVETCDPPTIGSDLLSIASIGSFDSYEEMEETFQNIEW